MIAFKNANHGLSSRGDPSCFPGCTDLIFDVRTRVRTQSLAPAPGCEEHPALPGKNRPQRIESFLTVHALSAAVIEKNRRERPLAAGRVNDSMQGEIATGKGDHSCRRRDQGKHEQNECPSTDHDEGFYSGEDLLT